MSGTESAGTLWASRVLVALDTPDGAPVTEGRGEEGLLEEVALRFADRFAPGDRDYAGTEDEPRWFRAVREAQIELLDRGMIAATDTLTEAGRAGVPAAETVASRPAPDGPRGTGSATIPLLAGVLTAPLRDPRARERMALPVADDEPLPVLGELNVQFGSGTAAAFARLTRLWARVAAATAPGPRLVADHYVSGDLTIEQLLRLVAADAVPVRWPGRSLYRLWPDFPIRPLMDASRVTVKADAAGRTFDAGGQGIVWAVVDSGVDGAHPHFRTHETLNHPSVQGLHRNFLVDGPPTEDGALVDTSGHGTHVAGIIAGEIGPWIADADEHRVYAAESRYNADNPDQPLRIPRQIADPAALRGVAPLTRLVSLNVLGAGGNRRDRVHRVIEALTYVRQVNGDSVESMRIHGVNLSVGYDFDPEWFACGRSPLCKEVDRLVRSGVVVVVAAGNSGYGTLQVSTSATSFGMGMTINDPGNAELAITVGSTHRSAPHAYGVSYFSSKGPTGDGRSKPDLVAPGERITSCAAGAALTAAVGGASAPPGTAVYVEDSGTSMAAPHVSGAIAALLSVRREFVGCPQDVKALLLRSATDLGRQREFQGHGLVDTLRTLANI